VGELSPKPKKFSKESMNRLNWNFQGGGGVSLPPLPPPKKYPCGEEVFSGTMHCIAYYY